MTRRARELLAAVEREAGARHGRFTVDDPSPPVVLGPALLTVLELAVAGLTRPEIARRLREEHGVAAPGPLLDAVFGPGAVRLARA